MPHRTKPFLIFFVAGLFTLGLWLASATYAAAATYYISPSGNNASSGTSASAPWKTFGYAIPQLNAGDTLILMDGTYGGSAGTGYPAIDCNTGAKNGSASARITLKAQNERKAFLKGDGSGGGPFSLRFCSYWNIEGLHAENGDFAGQNGGSVFSVRTSQHITMRRNLGAKNNRYTNSHTFVFTYDSKYVLLEENEAYDFHRHGFDIYQSSFGTFRRNYANSRGRASISGGFPGHSCCLNKGDEGFVLYGSDDSIAENNISEGNEMFSSYGERVKLLGNIVLKDHWGFVIQHHCCSAGTKAIDNTLMNNVAIDTLSNGYIEQSAVNTRVENLTSIGSKVQDGAAGNNKYSSQHASKAWTVYPSTTIRNSLFVNNAKYGLQIDHASDYTSRTLEYLNAFGNADGPYGPGTETRTNSTAIDPELGACRVFIPEGSPMKGAGKGGADIGANILYLYENGNLTNKPLWNPDPANGAPKGSFPCGATVNGVNNIPGQSCFDVHTRLNVNANSCNLPASYSGSWPPNPGPLPCITGCPTPTPTPSSSPTPTPTPIPKPLITLQAVPTTLIFPGQSSYMLWYTLHATSCMASGGWSGAKAMSGTAVLTPSATTTYTLTCTGPGGTASASITITVGTTTGYCHRYTSASPIPPGFGVPWDVTNPASLLLKAQCTGIGVTLELGDNNPYTYIYKSAYLSRPASSTWEPVTLLGAGMISSTWFPRTATAMITMSDTELTQTSHYVGYICKYNGSAWKCGCRDAACAQSYWQLQQFKR